MLDREEFVEQAYFFGVLFERLGQDNTLQELLEQGRFEVLATTKLPMAIEFLSNELKHSGTIAPAMRKISHYFTPFQSYIVEQSETDRGRFDFKTALLILKHEAEYRSRSDNRQGFFLYQFETLCRNRLNYDLGLKAMSEDPLYTPDWKEWILIVRKQLGFVDIADLIYGRSQEFVKYRKRHLGEDAEAEYPILFGEREGKIAFANRRKDPLFLFAAMQRHLAYPPVPKREIQNDALEMIPQMHRRIERLEQRIKLMEEEQRHGIDITKFYASHRPAPLDDLE
ncbi:MAG: hypothetical protein MUD03_09025 [Pirellula sp.]|jgi:hypothetical protein|nr:hypothetical protein [Pirellula sp.]